MVDLAAGGAIVTYINPTNPELAQLVLQEKILNAELDFVSHIPVSTEEKKLLLEKMLSKHQVNTSSDLPPKTAMRYFKYETMTPIDAEGKKLLIEKTTNDLNIVRSDMIKFAKSKGLIPAGIRLVKFAGSSFFFIEAVGRLYIWVSRHENPGFSPGLRYIQYILEN